MFEDNYFTSKEMKIFHLKNDTTLTLPAALPMLERPHLTHLGKMMQPDKPNWIKG